MNILFLHSSRHDAAPWRDGSTRYRCYHLAEALRALGHIADITSLTELQVGQLSRYSIVSVLRPRPSKTLDQLLQRCRRLGIKTIADVDDLVFYPKYAPLSPSVINNQATEFSIRAQFKRNLEAMLGFDEITVSTDPLAKHWTELTGKAQVTVVPNGLAKRWLGTRVARISDHQSPAKTITYLPGSNSHNKDFSEITNILCDAMNTNKEVKLLIVGTLQIDERVFPASRVMRSRWVDYYKLPQIIANSTVTLAPLVPSPFTYAKSHIKFIESAAFGTPAICSPNHDICRHQSDGLYICSNVEEWHTALDSALNSPMDAAERNQMEEHIRTSQACIQSAKLFLSQFHTDSNRSVQRAAAK